MIQEIQPATPPGWTWRTVFLGGFSLVAILIVASLGYLLFIRYPDLGSSGDANLALWVGDIGSKIVYLLISIALMGFYLWVMLQGTRLRGSQSWRIGALLGVPPGLLSLVVGITANLFTPTDVLGSTEQVVLFILGLAACLGAGIWGTRRGGHIGAGILAAFWCAFCQALLIAFSTIVQDILFADVLTRTIWSNDLTTVCRYRQGLSYQSCEVGDNLGAAANLLLAFPLIGTILGTVSSAITALFIRKRQSNPLTWRGEGRAPMIFAIFLLLVFLIEILGKIW